MYNLETVPRINEILFNVEQRENVTKCLNLKLKKWNFGGVNYNILKYDKQWLSRENESTIGLLRSIIFKDSGEIVSFAPPKSQNVEHIKFENDNKYVSEQFVEGTMINMFYDKEINSWQIATRTSVGGNINFYMENGFKSDNTFATMFDEIVNELSPNMKDQLNKDFVYSFVMQHPNNRIVEPIRKKRLFLVEIYQINGLLIQSKTHTIISNPIDNIITPTSMDVSNEDDLLRCTGQLASMNTSYLTMGVIIKDQHGNRYKFRNPNYEYVRKLRGNNPKLQFQYLTLRQMEKDNIYQPLTKLAQYLKYYPEHKNIFNSYRNIMHDYTNQLFINYISCYVKKERELNTFPNNFKTHMYILHHQHYLETLRPNKETITKHYVINYFNNIHPAKQMFVLNYNKRNLMKRELIEENELKQENEVE